MVPPPGSLLPLPFSVTVAPSATVWSLPASAVGAASTVTVTVSAALSFVPSFTVRLKTRSVLAVTSGAVKVGAGDRGAAQRHRRGSRLRPGQVSVAPSGSVALPSSVTETPSCTVWSLPAFAVGLSLSAVTVMSTVSALEARPRASVTVRLNCQRLVRRQVRRGERGLCDGRAAQRHRGPRRLAPGVAEGLSLGVGTPRAVERHRRPLVLRLVRARVRRRRVVRPRAHRHLHLVRRRLAARIRHREREGEVPVRRELVRGGELRLRGRAAAAERHPGGGRRIADGPAARVAAARAVQLHLGVLVRGPVGPRVRRRRRVHGDRHRVRRAVARPVVHRQAEDQVGVRGHVGGGEGRAGGRGAAQRHRGSPSATRRRSRSPPRGRSRSRRGSPSPPRSPSGRTPRSRSGRRRRPGP